MESLGFIAFFGILLINANSYKLELTMCIMTVFGISTFAFVLADLDDTFHGSFCVDLEPFTSFINNISDDYARLRTSEQTGTKEENHSIVTFM